MNNKNLYIFPISLIIFTLVEIFIIKNGQFTIGIYLYILYAISLYLINKKLIISFFVYNLPIVPLISTDYKVFSMLGPSEIIYGFSLLVLLSISSSVKRVKLNKYQKLSISFVYFLFFLKVYILIKDSYFGLSDLRTSGAFYIFKITVRYFLYYYSLVLLIKVIYLKEIFDYVFVGIKYSVLTIPISMIFTKALVLMGAGIVVYGDKTEGILSGEYDRYIGFYGAGGDENSVGIFLVAAFGFLLALYEKTGDIKKYVVFMGFAVLGVLLSGSRTSFLALVVIILIFLITNKSGSAKVYILIACVVFYFIFNEQLNSVIERFFDPSAKKAIDSNETGGRVGKWVYYIDWILNNPNTLILGNQKNISLDRAPHNYFIWIIYHVGLVPFAIFSRLLIKLIKSASIKMKATNLKNIYYIIPFLFVIMTVNSFGSSIYLWIYLPIGAYFVHSKKRNHFEGKSNEINTIN